MLTKPSSSMIRFSSGSNGSSLESSSTTSIIRGMFTETPAPDCLSEAARNLSWRLTQKPKIKITRSCVDHSLAERLAWDSVAILLFFPCQLHTSKARLPDSIATHVPLMDNRGNLCFYPAQIWKNGFTFRINFIYVFQCGVVHLFEKSVAAQEWTLLFTF